MSKYLTYEDRLFIEKGLRENQSFQSIAKQLGKDRTTISKEVRRYACDLKSGYSSYPYNACVHRKFCKKRDVCGNDCTRSVHVKCSVCNKCNDHCSDFAEEICHGRFSPPYVCNACEQYGRCTLKKYIYNAEEAHIHFCEKISESRTGIFAEEADLFRIASIITPLIKQGQSVHQIYVSHADELMCSEKTLYNYIDACFFEVRNIDLPRKVKYRPRYKKPEFKVDKGCRNGRSYIDFLKFIEAHPEYPVVQMDSVMGERGGKCLLTIHFVNTSFMIAFLRDANTSKSVIDVFNLLDQTLGIEIFSKLFHVILTDNGSEFSNPRAIEMRGNFNDYGPQCHRTNVFYCDPSKPYEKGAIEVNHELIRRVLPKGSGFNNLTQEDVLLMMNHINSYKRKKLNNRSPYEAFSFYYGEDIAQRLGYHQVPADEIILKPSLLKK